MANSTNDDDSFTENTCVVCFKNVEIYSVGDCDHPVCYECSTRMRVLCRQNECPICRHDMQKVIFTKCVKPYKELDKSLGFRFLIDRKFQIVFESTEVQRAYNALLAHTCSVCPNRNAFQTFTNLRDHMRKEHELFYCDLCVDNLKILTHERRCYTRKELATHRRQGDLDNRSHRGHPLCEFCNERYMDNDELYRHLRRDHLFCHFCDADGLHQYYDSYDVLRNHFRDQHYLCEEGDCYDEKFTSAFRSEIDLKAHRASVHGRQLGKAATKQARTLELEFVLKPRPRQGQGRGGLGRTSRIPPQDDEEEGAVGGFMGDRHQRVFPPPPPPPEFSTTSREEFPSLGGTSVTPVLPRPATFLKKGPSSTRSALTQEDFPVLGRDVAPATPTTSVSLRVSAADRAKGNKPTNLSIHVNHRPGGVVATVNSRAYSAVSSKAPSREPETKVTIKPSAPASADDSSRKQRVLRLFNTNLADDTAPPVRNDFPALSSNLPAHISSLASTQWSSGREPEPKVFVNKSKPSQPPPKPPQPKTFHIEDDFPSLNSRFDASCSFTPEPQPTKSSESKAKKESSLSITVDNNWQTSSVKKTKQPTTSAKATLTTDNVSSDSDIGCKKGNKKKKSISKTPKETSETSSSASSKKSNNHNNNNNNNETGKKSKQKEESNSKAKHIKTEAKLEKTSEQKENQGSSQTNKTQETMERKRSELKIDSLTDHSSTENSMNMSDFPSLSNGSRLPPGFANIAREKTPAPPGFDCGANPPPGFSITLNSVARPHNTGNSGNGLTFTSSSGQSYPIPSGDIGERAFEYVAPRDARQRNAALVSRVTEALGSREALDLFLQCSTQYRQDSLSADDYYRHCRDAMPADVFPQLFPELLALLPDIHKQQELWRVVERPAQWGLDVCAACGQVVTSADLKHHLSTHSLSNHFPALSSTAPSRTAWTSH